MPYKWKDKEKEYHKEYHADWYKKNKDKVKDAAKKAREKKREWYRELKKKYSCEHCGEKHPACIEFHHKDPSKKDFMLSRFHSRSKEAVLEELKKCVPLCRNCHAKLHWELNNQQ